MHQDPLLEVALDWVRAGSTPLNDAELLKLGETEDARLLADAFTGEEGRKRLLIFARMTILRPSVDGRFPTAEGQSYAHERNGQNSIFAALVRYLDLHAASQRKPQDDRSTQPAGIADERIERAPRPDAGEFDSAGLVAVV